MIPDRQTLSLQIADAYADLAGKLGSGFAASELVLEYADALEKARNLVLVRYAASQASGTTAGGQIGLMTPVVATKLLGGPATGAAITVYAENVLGTNVFNCKLNSGNRPKVKSSTQGTNTLAAAGVWIKSLGLQFGAIITTSAVHTGSNFIYDFNGEFVLPEGTAVYVASSIASVALFQQSLTWYEVPNS